MILLFDFVILIYQTRLVGLPLYQSHHCLV